MAKDRQGPAQQSFDAAEGSVHDSDVELNTPKPRLIAASIKGLESLPALGSITFNGSGVCSRSNPLLCVSISRTAATIDALNYSRIRNELAHDLLHLCHARRSVNCSPPI